jgi:hypothetical protein
MPRDKLASELRFLAPASKPRQHCCYMRLVRGSLIVMLGLLGNARAEGDALVDMLGPREIAVGEAMRGAATGSSAIMLNPAGLPLNRELVFEAGYGYRMADQGSIFGISACDSTNAAPGCFYYSYAGASPELSGMALHRRTHMAGTSVAYPVTPRVLIGSSLKYYNFQDDAMPAAKTSGFNTDFGTTLRIAEAVNVGAAFYNLFGGADAPEFARAVGGGVQVRPLPTLAVSFDARWKLEGDDRSARFGGGAELFLRSGYRTGFPLRVGGLRDNGLGATYVSAGVGVASMTFGVDVAARRAVSGPEHTMFIASMRVFGPRLRAPSPDGIE